MPESETSQRTTFPPEDVAMWNADLPPGFQARRLHSHILLAACAYSNPALESSQGGLFTRALLNQLERSNERSYQALMRSIVDDSDLRTAQQQPVCYGTNMHRQIFDRSISIPKHLPLPLQFSIAVGNKTSDVLFEVFSDNCKLGTLKVSDSTASHTFVTYNEGDFFSTSHVADLEAKEVVNEATPKQAKLLKLFLSAPVGRLHGATSTTQFVVISGDKEIGRLKVLNCYPTHCTLQYDSATFDIPTDAVAYILPTDQTIIDVHLAGDWSQQERDELESASNHPNHSFRLVDSENSHVELSWVPESNNLGAKWKVPLLESDTVVRLPVARGDMSRVLSVIQSIGNFRYHFCRSFSSPPQDENNTSSDYQSYGPLSWLFQVSLPYIRNLFSTTSYESESNSWTGFDNLKRDVHGRIRHFSIHLYGLERDSENFRFPKRETDYLVPSCQPIVGGESRFYGIEVVNESSRPVFPYLFCFDPCSYEIQVRLHDAYIPTHVFFQLWNQAATDSGDVLPGAQEAKDKKSNKFTIGFGEGGGNPITFTPGETIFLKLFASTESWGNVQFMEQSAVSEGFESRAKRIQDPVGTDFADAFLFKVVVQA